MAVLWGTPAQGKETTDEWAVLDTPLARQMGLPARLEEEQGQRLKGFITEVVSSVSCGRDSCAHWEADSGPILLSVASLQELRKRGEGSLPLTARTVFLLGALENALHDAVVPGRPGFLEERKTTRTLLRHLAEEVLRAIPVHPSTLRTLSQSAFLEGEFEAGRGWKTQYLERRPDDPLGKSLQERREEAMELSESLLAALGKGEKERALDLTGEVAERLPRTQASDYMMALYALFDRDALGVLDALRRLELRGEISPALKAEVHRLGAVIARKSRLVGPEKHHLNSLLEMEGDAPLCPDSGFLLVEIKLPCMARLSRVEAVERLEKLTPQGSGKAEKQQREQDTPNPNPGETP